MPFFLDSCLIYNIYITLFVQMQGFNNSRLFRIYNLKRKDILNNTMKGISMNICAPILKEYKSIDLSKSNITRRIRHKTTYDSNSVEEKEMQKLISGKKWQNVLGEYIQAKEQIVIKKGQLNSFQFLKLNKTNKNLYKRLVKRESLPESYMKKTINQQPLIKQQPYMNKSRQHLKSKETLLKDHKSISDQITYHETEYNNPSQIQYEDKVLNNFLSNYFKKKYKKQIGKKELIKYHHVQYHIFSRSKKKLPIHHHAKDQLYRTNTN